MEQQAANEVPTIVNNGDRGCETLEASPQVSQVAQTVTLQTYIDEFIERHMLDTLTQTCTNLLQQQVVSATNRSEDPSGNRPGSTHPRMPEDPVSTGNRLSKRPLADGPSTADDQQWQQCTETAKTACLIFSCLIYLKNYTNGTKFH